MPDDAVNLSLCVVNMYKINLLKFYCVEYLTFPVAPRCGHLDTYTCVIFQLPFETDLIESLFSITNYNKDRTERGSTTKV